MKSLKNWKTSLAGILAFVLLAAHQFYPSVFTSELTGAITTILVSAGLLAAKDNNVTGGTTPQ
jgi:hypothetical protein